MTIRTNLRPLLLAAALLCCARSACAQLSFSSAIDLAIENSPKVKAAQADAARAQASLEEVHDAYVPTVVASSSGLGDSTGFPLGLPTVFSISAQSLVFSYSQKDYIRAAAAGLDAARLALEDARAKISEDAATTYLTLQHDEQKRDALTQQAQAAARLEAIVKDRLDAGQDTAMDYTRARRTGVQLRLELLQQEDAIASGRDRLARMVGLPGTPIATVADSVPPLPAELAPDTSEQTPGVKAAFATARSKREQAFGDARYTLRPQVALGAQYSRFSTYNNNYATYYPGIQNQPNAFGLALDITVPFFDMGHRAHARESLAEAERLQQEAILGRDQSAEGRLKLQHAIAEGRARAELASLDRDLAQQQLAVVMLQLNQPQPAGAQVISPKDEQTARIEERRRYIDMLDAQLDLQQAEIQLLRQTDQLSTWIHAATPSTLQPTVLEPARR